MSGPRAPRCNYLQLNDGSDDEGDSDSSQPPRSRRRINSPPEIIPNESVSQVNTLASNASASNASASNELASQVPSIVSQSSSLGRVYKPKPKESWV